MAGKVNATLMSGWPGDVRVVPSVPVMKPRTVLVALVALVLLVAGCGGGSTQSSGSASSTGAATSPGAASTSSGAPTSSAAGADQKAVPAEKNPPGDIPDNLAFVLYRSSAGRYSFRHPEGWSQSTHGSTVTFTDKLNGVQVAIGSATATPTVASARQQDVPRLTGSQAAFELRSVTAVSTPAGPGVRIVYRRNSAPDAVTGRQYRDEVERYELFAHGHEVVVELFGPVGADNVDAYRTMIQSLRFS
jgi:hypothetical protein